ncbi:hypothetical protein BCR35DRAFT_62384 [Leucosporidium creatinivorum]|uniref:Uncharacterized protein n=1 Tax=Leucosporidium creatinivorum TaxID=106004 RepID=A0A1Y2FKQ6_9BASI|nr:hypothetical protein BCR35DRAFT_62384 [Leucosporidium creatinivorum]
MQWDSQASSTEHEWIDSQGSEVSQWSQQQWTSSQDSYSTNDTSQQHASSLADAFAPSPLVADSFAQAPPYAEQHQYAQEPFPPYHAPTHAPHHDSVDPRYTSQRFTGSASHPAIDPNVGEGQHAMPMEGMDVQGWHQQQDSAQEYYAMDTSGADQGVTPSPNDQFAFGAPQAQQFADYSPQSQRFDFDQHQALQSTFQPPDQYAYSPTPIPSPSSSLQCHTPSSSLSSLSFAYPSNPTSPAYSQYTQNRSRQHSLDSAPPPSSARPQPLRRLSQSGGRPFAPHPYAPPPTRPALTSSRSSSSLPSSRRGSVVLPSNAAIRPAQQRQASPFESRNPRRRASQPSLSITTAQVAAGGARRPSASASSSPVNSRFALAPFSASSARATFNPLPLPPPPPPPSATYQKPPPPCSMFDSPLVRQFGALAIEERGGSGRGSAMRPEEVLSSETVGLGMEMGGFQESGVEELVMMQREERSYPPRMTSALMNETIAFLGSPNRFTQGERSILIFSPKRIHPSAGAERFKLFPQPTALLLGTNWTSTILPSPPSAPSTTTPKPPAAAPLVVPPRLHLSTTLRWILNTPEVPSNWMAQDGMLVDWNEATESAQIIAGRATGEGVEAPEATVGMGMEEDKKRVFVAVVVDGAAPVQDRLLGVFPGAEMRSASAEETGEPIHHGSLIAISNRMKDSSGWPRFLAVSGTASTFPTIDWRAITGGTPRPYKFARSEFTTKSNAWDSFVVYAVDPRRKEMEESGAMQREKLKAFRAGYPAPPAGVLPFDPMAPSLIHYNQPIVLQCMSTAAVSVR